jgi:hypothetical protein
MRATICLLAVLVPLLSLGCEKTIHEVNTPLPPPAATLDWR